MLSYKWWETWKGYVGYVENGVKPAPCKKPGKIHNSDLEGDIKGSIRDDVLHEVHYKLLPKNAWDFLHHEYKGGPTFGRLMIFDGTLKVEMLGVFD